MSTLITPAQEQFDLAAIDTLNLPDDLKSLLSLFENSPSLPTKICALAKIKHQILISLHPLINPETLDSSQPFQPKTALRKDNSISGWTDDPHNLFSRVLLRFLNRTSPPPATTNETKLFFHVVSLAIKHFYDEQEFKYLFNAITDLIDHRRDKVQTALEFFEQVIGTLEYNGEEKPPQIGEIQQSKISHCHFERHFTTNHLNSMLMIANFLLEKSILRDNEAVQDGVNEDSFKIRSSEDQLLAIFSLLHRVFSFDFIGEKYGESEELSEWGSIVIPTKSIRPNTFASFQNWVKNSEWIRIYQFIYGSCHLLKLKLLIVDILGDMSRIHMKYFKNKGNYKIHIENVIFALADILEQTKISVKSEEALQIALAIGRNLLKLTAPSVLPLFFEIAPNISKGLLDNIRKFLIQQIINEEVLNVNIVYYFFKFLENLSRRTKFQKNNIPEEIIEERLREIGRSYEHYLRNMMNKIFKLNYSRNNDNYHHRYDYINLKDIFSNYDIPELLIFFMPFRIMKPRYGAINSIYDLLVYICARFIRSVYILEAPRLENWERDISVTNITQCIDKVIEWQSFTTYHKKRKGKTTDKQGRHSQLFVEKTHYARLSMEPIREEYEEEIQNEYEYCHFLRVICFCMVEVLNQKEAIFLSRLNSEDSLYKLVNLILELVFHSDLEDPANEQHKNSACLFKISYFLQQCYLLVAKLLVKEFEYSLLKVMRSNQYKYRQFYYRYAVEETEIQFIEVVDIKQKIRIVECIDQLKQRCLPEQYTPPLLALQFLLIYSVSFPLKKDLGDRLFVKNINYCLTYLSVIQMNPTLLALIHQRQTTLFTFLQGLNVYLASYQFKSLSNSQIMDYFNCLSIMINLNLTEFSEEALNKTFVGLKSLLHYMDNNEEKMKLDQEFCAFLEAISKDILNRSNDLEFVELRDEIIQVIKGFEMSTEKQSPHQQRMEIEEAIINTTELQFSEVKSSPNIVKERLSNHKQNTALNGQHHTKSEKGQPPLQIQIYNGYHREKTLSIMNRYLMEEKTQIALVQDISVHSGTSTFSLQKNVQYQQVSQNILCEGEYQILVHRLHDDAERSDNRESPMDIQASLPETDKLQQRKEEFHDAESEINNENIFEDNHDANEHDGTSCSEEQPHQSKGRQCNSNDRSESKELQQQQTPDNISILIVNQIPQNQESKQLTESAQNSSSLTVILDSSKQIPEHANDQTNENISQMISQEIPLESPIAYQQPLNHTSSQDE